MITFIIIQFALEHRNGVMDIIAWFNLAYLWVRLSMFSACREEGAFGALFLCCSTERTSDAALDESTFVTASHERDVNFSHVINLSKLVDEIKCL